MAPHTAHFWSAWYLSIQLSHMVPSTTSHARLLSRGSPRSGSSHCQGFLAMSGASGSAEGLCRGEEGSVLTGPELYFLAFLQARLMHFLGTHLHTHPPHSHEPPKPALSLCFFPFCCIAASEKSQTQPVAVKLHTWDHDRAP